MGEISLFDEVRVVKLKPRSHRMISDEEQLAQIELTEASVAFANANAKAATTREPADIEEAQELEVKLVNLFFAGGGSDLIRQAWRCYRRRLLYHHRVEG
jgi:hypothetical protein